MKNPENIKGEGPLVVSSANGREDLETILNINGLDQHPNVLSEDYKVSESGERKISQVVRNEEGKTILIKKEQKPGENIRVETIDFGDVNPS